jgi:hypothetical protein
MRRRDIEMNNLKLVAHPAANGHHPARQAVEGAGETGGAPVVRVSRLRKI